jgi:hypothetical protein
VYSSQQGIALQFCRQDIALQFSQQGIAMHFFNKKLHCVFAYDPIKLCSPNSNYSAILSVRNRAAFFAGKKPHV